MERNAQHNASFRCCSNTKTDSRPKIQKGEPMTTEQDIADFAQTTAAYFTGAAVSTGVHLGDRLGLYTAMAGDGLLRAQEIATRAGCNSRLVREWLDGQAAAGLINYDAAADAYELTDAGAFVLADENSPAFMARGAQALGSLSADMDKIEQTYRGNRTLEWGEHHQCLFDGVEWFFRPGYRAFLTTAWLPAIPGLVEKLNTGASVLDVGCGHGASLVAMAAAYPNSHFTGVEPHPASVEAAHSRIEAAGVANQCALVEADAQSYDGTYDLICFFDCLHDMGDPVGAAQHASAHLREDGAVLLVEPFALDDRGTNIANNPLAAMSYHASAMICTPTSLSQSVALGLGGQAGQEQLKTIMNEAGFTQLERRAETPFNLILEARA